MSKKQSSLSEKSEFMNTKIDSKNSLKAKKKKWSLKKKLFVCLLLILSFISSGFLYEYKQKRSHFFIPTNGIYSEYFTSGDWFFTKRWSYDAEKRRTTYKDGLKNGQQIDYNFTSQMVTFPSSISEFKNDKEIETKLYNSDGNINRALFWIDEDIVQSKMWSDSGVLISELYFLNGKLDGIQKFWSNDGIKIYEVEYKNGVIDGNASIWDDNDGGFLASAKFIDGEINGSFQTIVWDFQNLSYSSLSNDIHIIENINSFIINDRSNGNTAKKLMISKKPLGNGNSTFDIALAATEDCIYGGFTDWRLPNRDELRYYTMINYIDDFKLRFVGHNDDATAIIPDKTKYVAREGDYKMISWYSESADIFQDENQDLWTGKSYSYRSYFHQSTISIIRHDYERPAYPIRIYN